VTVGFLRPFGVWKLIHIFVSVQVQGCVADPNSSTAFEREVDKFALCSLDGQRPRSYRATSLQIERFLFQNF